MNIVLGFLCTLVLSACFTPIVRNKAAKLGFVAAPRGDRWHSRPTAMLGGVAIYLAFILGYLAFGPRLAVFVPVLAATTLLFLAGLIDDIYCIKAHTKLIVQLIAASIVVCYGLRLPWTGYEGVDICITIFWLVGITNAINLLDNMDGLSAGVSVIACAFLVVTFLLNGQVTDAIIPALIGGAALGFLLFNFNPASIFMGDCGSMLLGFVLACTALLSDTARLRNLASVLLTPVLILMLPIFDTCVVIVARVLSGRPVSQGGRDHTSHRLVALGTSERRAVVLLYCFATASGLLALMMRLLETSIIFLLLPAFALFVLCVGLFLGRARVYEEGHRPREGTAWATLANFSHKRRVLEVLLDVVLIVFAYYGSYLLRWDGTPGTEQLNIFFRTLPIIILVQLAGLLIGGVYRGIWRYAGTHDLLVITKSVLGATAVAAATVFVMHAFHGPSRAVFLLDAMLLSSLVGLSRLSFRLLRMLIPSHGKIAAGAKPVLIYGAGDGGEMLIREILKNGDHPYSPVAFIDDDARKAGKVIHGYKIFNSGELPKLIDLYKVNDVLISSFKVPESKLNSLRNMGMGLKKLSIRLE